MKSCMSMTLILFLAMMTTAAAADKGRVVAKLNGAPVYENEVLGWMSHGQVDPEALNQRIQAWVVTELAYRDAKDQGLDEDEAFRERLKTRLDQAKKQEAQALASIYEQSIKSLTDARDPEAIPAEHIDAFFAKLRGGEESEADNAAKQKLRHTLTQQRYRMAYAAWLKEIVRDVPVAINSKPVPVSLFETELDAMLTKSTDDGGEIAGLIREAAGLPAKNDPKPDAETVKAAKDALGAVTLTVGKKTFRLDSPGAGWLRDTLASANAQYAFDGLKVQVVAAKARQEGLLDKLPDPTIEIEKKTLGEYMLEVNGITGTDHIEVSEEAFESYRETRGKPIWDSMVKNGDEERARTTLMGHYKGELAREARQAYIEGLLEGATIEYLDF